MFAGCAFSKTKPVPPSKKDILGMWIGFTSDGNSFYRVLLSEKDGVLARSFVGEEPMLYKFNSWNLNSRGQIYISPTPVSSNAFAIRLSGNAWVSKIFLKQTPRDGGWTEEFMLQKEDVLEKRFSDLKNAMK
jgi:hypothetical protein